MGMTKAFTWLAAIAALALTSCNPEKKPAEVQTAHDMTGWSTDLDKGFADAKAAKKPLMVEFTGSTWCPQCVVMTKNVFAQPEFIEAASKKVVLVEIDVPFDSAEDRKKAGPAGERNMALAEKYKINEFPHVVLFDPEGKEISRFLAADYPKIDVFLQQLDKELKKSGS